MNPIISNGTIRFSTEIHPDLWAELSNMFDIFPTQDENAFAIDQLFYEDELDDEELKDLFEDLVPYVAEASIGFSNGVRNWAWEFDGEWTCKPMEVVYNADSRIPAQRKIDVFDSVTSLLREGNECSRKQVAGLLTESERQLLGL